MTELSQKLKSRHMNMIAFGGSIGTGMFMTTGYAISAAGPGGALAAYIIMAIIVYFLMTSLGEMSTHKPSAGSFCDYSQAYVGNSFGFAMGYNYWLNWAITLAAEVSAATLVMSYWFPTLHSFIFSASFFALLFFFNIFSVRLYGETEYWMSLVKVLTIIAFILFGLIALFHTPHFGLNNWHIGDGPFHTGLTGFLIVFLFAGFSFQGSELVGVASAEVKDPHLSIPRSIKRVFWRLFLFYVASIALIGLLIPYTDPHLASQNDVTLSPFTIVFHQYFSNYAASFINFVILMAVLSAGNASLYSSTRILWYLSKTRQAPAALSRLTHQGVPLLALVLTAVVGALGLLSSIVNNGVLFQYLLQISSLSGFIAWFGIALSHYQFRRKYLPHHGGLKSLSYKAKFYPVAQVISMVFIVFIVFAQFLTIGSEGRTFWNMMMVYSSVILFFVLYLGHKIYGASKVR